MSEQYRKNVQAMCDRLGLPNPIQENDIVIQAITFYSKDQEKRIEGTDMNCAGRLFFQDRLLPNRYKSRLAIDSLLIKAAQNFFAENWNDAEENGRQMLIAIKSARRYKVHWKRSP